MTSVPTIALHDIATGLRTAGEMLWQTLWALVLGFGISGALQAFVPRRTIESRLGDHRPAAVARASLYGAASSSCSYAAAAVARSLRQRGADSVTATIFMVASTNLVVELGIVLLVLIGWQFAVADIVGGLLMIVLLALVGSVALGAAAGPPAPAPEAGDVDDERWWQRARTRQGWSDAVGYAIGDLVMLRRELAVGYLVAGFLAALVPSGAWQAAFLHGHGVWTAVENAVVGPAIAVVSFVCSVGNVPLAAALWHGGIGFGGVVAFVLADLVSCRYSSSTAATTVAGSPSASWWPCG